MDRQVVTLILLLISNEKYIKNLLLSDWIQLNWGQSKAESEATFTVVILQPAHSFDTFQQLGKSFLYFFAFLFVL